MTWPLVIGLGSSHGDDQAGWLTLDRLRNRGFPCEYMVRARHPAELLDVVDAGRNNARPLVICDACLGNGFPGAVHCFRWPTDRIVYQKSMGSHDLSLCDVMELGRNLHSFPETAEVWALEGSSWTPGTEPSAAIQSAASRVADAIWEGCCRA